MLSNDEQSAATLRVAALCAAVAVIALAAFARPAAAAMSQKQLMQTTYVDFNCKNEDVVNIIRLFAEQYSLNIIISPNVRGALTMKLQNVTLESAFEEILATSNAYMVEKNNIIHIYARGENPDEKELEDAYITEIFEPSYVESAQLREVLTPFQSPDGRIQLFKDTRPGSEKPMMLIITDRPERIEVMRKLIEKLDVETRQVLIQAKIVETSLSNNELLGVDWSIGAELDGPPFKFDSEYASGGKIKFGTLSLQQFGAVLERLSTAGKTNLLSDMSIATIDGAPAFIHVGEQIPVGVTTVGTGGGGGVVLGTTGIQNFEVGIRLSVTPHILNDDTIRMDVSPEISSVKGFTSLGGGGGSSAPITNRRTADTNIMVRSGETIVIGGLVQDSITETRSKVPILGDLPVVGSWFRHKNTSKEKTDLIIFITAVIMEKRAD